MFTKLAAKPTTESTLTPYDKASRTILAFMLAGKLGSFDPTDLAHLNALESELLEYEKTVANASDTGDAKDGKTGSPAKPGLTELQEGDIPLGLHHREDIEPLHEHEESDVPDASKSDKL
jgi:hypothetical protein